MSRSQRDGNARTESDGPRREDGWIQYGLDETHIREGTPVYVTGHGPARITNTPDGNARKTGYQVTLPDGSNLRMDAKAFAPMASPSMKLEFLSRRADDSRRRVSSANATFNLVSTIVGGGVLSLPYAMSQCGVLLGSLALIYSSFFSAFSIDMLVFSSRRTGRENYMQLAHKAYGAKAQTFTSILIFLLVWLGCVAYDVLIGDLLSGVANIWFHVTPLYRKLLIIGAIGLASPWCYKENLHSLRYLSVLSIVAVIFVAGALSYDAMLNVGHDHWTYTTVGSESQRTWVKWRVRMWPEDWSKALYVFPIFGVAFLCHFNVLPIHTELKKPTKKRIRRVMNGTISICAFIYTIVGFAGYFWAFDETCGNILLNFPHDNYLMAAARVALSLVLIGSYPLLVLPCRTTLHRLLCVVSLSFPTCFGWYNREKDTSLEQPLLGENPMESSSPPTPVGLTTHNAHDSRQGESSVSHYRRVNSDPDLAHLNVPGLYQNGTSEGVVSPAPSARSEVQIVKTSNSAHLPPNNASPRNDYGSTPTHSGGRQRKEKIVHVYARNPRTKEMDVYDTYRCLEPQSDGANADPPTPTQRFWLTTFILISNLAIGLLLEAIMIVWTILGSTVSFAIAFILPSTFFLKLHWNRSSAEVSCRRKFIAVVMLVTSSIFCVVCTVMVVLNLNPNPCPGHA